MSEYLSRKLTIVSFILIVLIVFLHGFNLNMAGNNQTTWLRFMEYFISDGLTRIAVPLFFFISGYLFFVNYKGFKWSFFSDKIKKRLKSLVIPYLIVATVSATLFVIFQKIPFTAHLFHTQLSANSSFYDWLEYFYINPVAYQLWFIRDLFFMVLISPAVVVLNRYTYGLWLSIVLYNWIFGLIGISFFETQTIFQQSLLFFSLGALMATHFTNVLEIKMKSKYVILLSILWFSGCLFLVFFRMNGFLDWYFYLSPFTITLGCVAFWYLYDLILERRTKSYSDKAFIKTSFFVYLFHEPLLTLFKKMCFSILGTPLLVVFTAYWLIPLVVVFFLIVLSFLVKKHTPRVYFLITGSR